MPEILHGGRSGYYPHEKYGNDDENDDKHDDEDQNGHNSKYKYFLHNSVQK